MTAYKDMSVEELMELKSELEQEFEEVKAKGLKLICPVANRPWHN